MAYVTKPPTPSQPAVPRRSVRSLFCSSVELKPHPPRRPSIGDDYESCDTGHKELKLPEHKEFGYWHDGSLPPASSQTLLCMDSQGIVGGGGGHSHGSATSPVSVRSSGGTGGGKRKRSGAEFESSPGSGGEHEEEEGERRRQPGVKRACNECRQQKVTHSINSSHLEHNECDSESWVMELIHLAYSYDAMLCKTRSRPALDVRGSNSNVKSSPTSSGLGSEVNTPKWRNKLNVYDEAFNAPRRRVI